MGSLRFDPRQRIPALGSRTRVASLSHVPLPEGMIPAPYRKYWNTPSLPNVPFAIHAMISVKIGELSTFLADAEVQIIRLAQGRITLQSIHKLDRVPPPEVRKHAAEGLA